MPGGWVRGGCGGGAGCCVEYSLNILQRRACFSTFPCLNISRPGGETVVGGGGFRSDFHTLLFFSAAVKGEEGARQATAASNKQDEAMCVRVFEVGLRSVSTPVSPPPPFSGFLSTSLALGPVDVVFWPRLQSPSASFACLTPG